MKINITKKEYRTLLEMLEIASWVLFAHKIEDDPETEKYRDLEQKFFSYARDMGLKHLISWDLRSEKFLPTAEYEDQSPVMNYIDEYDDVTFWETLVERLSFRDLLRQEGEEKLKEMSLEEGIEKQESIREKYYKEFESKGLKTIKIES